MGFIEYIDLFKQYDNIDSGKIMYCVYKVKGLQCHGVQGVLIGQWHWCHVALWVESLIFQL